jgi:hypothetical protein
MTYKVQFVGLVCFVKHKGAVHALMPNGRHPPHGIPRHMAFIVVEKSKIDENATRWPPGERVDQGEVLTRFWFPPSQIELDGIATPGDLMTAEQDARLPRLSLYPNHVRIDPYRAPAIGHVPIRSGYLAAYRRPGSEDNGTAALISELTVDHPDQIRISVTPHCNLNTRTIVLTAGTEIVFLNQSEPDGDFDIECGDAGVDEGGGEEYDQENHFELYGYLTTPPVELGAPGPTPRKIPESDSQHPIWDGPIGLTPRCSNTGCC